MRLFSLCLALCLTSILNAQDWPQWLGPKRDGSIDVTITPWQGPLEVAWKAKVGDGHSSPIVAGGMVFLHQKMEGADEEQVNAWDLEGNIKWKAHHPRGPFSSQFGVGPRATPAFANGKLYTLGVTGILMCREAATGKELWSRNILMQFKGKNLFFGTSSSPLVDDRNVYVMPGGEEGSVVAINKDSGEIVWTSGKDRASYSSPMSTRVGDKTYLVFQTEKGVVGLEPDTGKEVFRIPLKDLLNESSTTPVRVGDILFASSVTFGSLGIKLGNTDGQVVTSQAWKNPGLTCYFGTPVVFDGKLYAVTGQVMKPSAALHCIDPTTGKSLWNKSGVGKYHATLLKTKDKLLMLEEKGDLVLLEPSSESYKELARSNVCGHTWAHPAYAHGMLFVRDDKELKAVKLGK